MLKTLKLGLSRNYFSLFDQKLVESTKSIYFSKLVKTPSQTFGMNTKKQDTCDAQYQIDFKEKDKLLSDVFDIATEKVVKACRDRSQPVIRFQTPQELEALVDFHLPTKGVEHSELLKLCNQFIENSVATGHPRFMNQQYGGLDLYGLAAEILTSSLNANGHTFEVSPMFSVAETALINHIVKFIWKDGEGTFCPGGSYANMLAMNLAKINRFPNSNDDGITGLPKLVSFCSEQAHYSAIKNCALLGFGTKNMISVKCDDRGKMIPEELERHVKEAKEAGSVPFFLTATAATTVLGAFDPFDEIADICEKHGVWMHVDGAWGASALLSKKYKHLCKGIERADSVAWNFHKMPCVPLQCSAFLVREKGLMAKYHTVNVPYLFQEGKPYDQEYDLSRKLVQCSRKNDAFKLWFMWKAKGDQGMEKMVNKAFDNSEYFLREIKKRDNFRLVIPEVECTNVSFWFIPPSMRGEKEGKEYFEKLAKVVPIIKLSNVILLGNCAGEMEHNLFYAMDRMQKKGTLMIGFSPIPGTPTFFRLTVMNELVTHEDMDFVLDEIERNGSDL